MPVIKLLTSKVGLLQPRSEPGLVWAMGLDEMSVRVPTPLNHRRSVSLGPPLPTMCVNFACALADDCRNPRSVCVILTPLGCA